MPMVSDSLARCSSSPFKPSRLARVGVFQAKVFALIDTKRFRDLPGLFNESFGFHNLFLHYCFSGPLRTYVYPVSRQEMLQARFLRQSLSDGWGKSSEPKKLANVIAEQGDGDAFDPALPQGERRTGRNGIADFIEAGLLAAGTGVEHKNFHRLRA